MEGFTFWKIKMQTIHKQIKRPFVMKSIVPYIPRWINHRSEQDKLEDSKISNWTVFGDNYELRTTAMINDDEYIKKFY